MKATISLLGLYKYYPSLFAGLQLPAGIDRDIVINNLLLETAELELLFPNPDTLQFAIQVWSAKELPIWERLFDTTKYEYNPIHNYDRTETFLETRDLSNTFDSTQSFSGSNNETRNIATSSSSTATTGSSGTNTESRAGFDSDSLHTQAQQSQNNSGNSSETLTGTNTGTDNFATTDNGTINNNGSDTGTVKHENHIEGNIGVMSTQQMIEQQRSIVQFNVVDYIIHSFIKRFCLLIY